MTRFSQLLMLAAGVLLAAPSAGMAQNSIGSVLSGAPQSPEDVKQGKLDVLAGDVENDYTPPPGMLTNISAEAIEQARGVVVRDLPQWGFLPARGGTGGIASLKVDLSRLEILDRDGRRNLVPLGDAQISVTYPRLFDSVFWIHIDGNKFGSTKWTTAQVNGLIDALYILKYAAHRGLGDDAAFAKTAADYRAASPKPNLPEDVRRYQVEAEGAVKDGDFAEAVMLFGKALDIAPWWPGGHFNRAAVLAEIGEYQLAMAEMKRYLLLVPDAPDARASQDKIYDWERLADKAATANTPSPAPSRAAPF